MGFDPITAALNIGNTVLDRVLPDKAANDAAKAKLMEIQLSGELAQITAQTEINKAEATNTNIFVSGWRPFIGWVCGCGLAYQFLARPLLTFLADLVRHPTVAPELDMGTLLTLLAGMLGLAGARTYEKLNGVSNAH